MTLIGWFYAPDVGGGVITGVGGSISFAGCFCIRMMIPPSLHDTTLHGAVGRISAFDFPALAIGAIWSYRCSRGLALISSHTTHTFINSLTL